MQFENKVVLITGAASGIGEVAAKMYAAEGAKVVVGDVNEEGGRETVTAIEDSGGTAMFVKVNVARYEDVENLIKQTVETYGRIDVGVNNAGIGGKVGRTAEADIEDWDRVMAINATGVFYCMKLELQEMLKQGGGCIINTSSIAGLRGLPSNLAYSASKHAVVGMTKTAAMEYARHKIRINAICPVFTISPLFQPAFFDKISPGLSDKLKQSIPMKRFGQPEEIARVMLWLASEQASFVTGQAFPVDGGLTA